MADSKISELTSVVALADADLLVAVQGGTTKKLSGVVMKNYVSPVRTTVNSIIDADMILLDGNRQISLANLKVVLGIV
jgi:hypothetical protein